MRTDKVQYLRCISFRNLHDSSGTPQTSLELNESKLLDSFISLHTFNNDKEEVLVYISEVIKYNMNPNFTEIALPYVPNAKHNDKLVIRLWSKQRHTKKWGLLIHFRVKLSKLIFFGTICDNTEDDFNNNSIILNMNGRYYTLPESLKQQIPLPKEIVSALSTVNNGNYHTIPSYTFDSIRSITNLSKSIDELRIAKHKLSQQISHYIGRSQNDDYEIAKLKKKILHLGKSISKQKSINSSTEDQIYLTKIKITQYKQIIEERKQDLTEESGTQREILASQVDPINDTLHNSTYPTLVKLLIEHVEVLDLAITISLDSGNFKIMDIEFPQSIPEILLLCYSQETHQHINAALSYISQMIVTLGQLTNTPLKYPIVLSSDESVILDPSTLTAVVYPLYYDPHMSDKIGEDTLKNLRFEYGLGLLNRDMNAIIANVKRLFENDDVIPIDCYDNFLWNLHYLILLITADQGDLVDQGEIDQGELVGQGDQADQPIV